MWTRSLIIALLLGLAIPAAGTADAQTASNGCAVPTRLSEGVFITVSPGPPNNVRAAPSLSTDIVGTLPTGAFAAVMEGPVCADGLRLWRVSNEVTNGWTAEGEGAVYWLQDVG
ncbi:MAG: hypothetical protein ACOCYT_02455 [Chloroflexota bacterium]